MIRNPIDIATYTSPGLSTLIEKVVNDPDIEDIPTLSGVRDFLRSLLPESFAESEKLHHFDVDESLLDELNTLIEEFGEDALAHDFVRAYANEALSRAIEIVAGDENWKNHSPTLQAIRDAISSGLGASMVGEGILDGDEDETLMMEVDSLIEHYEPDALAENFVRYE